MIIASETDATVGSHGTVDLSGSSSRAAAAAAAGQLGFTSGQVARGLLLARAHLAFVAPTSCAHMCTQVLMRTYVHLIKTY